MNKKFLSAILFGALMVTSTGTFVSCKDYDDEIKDLQTQINKLATKDELSSQIATLEAALNAAASNAATAIQKAEGAEKAAAEAEAAAIAAVQEELAKAKTELEDLVAGDSGALTTMNATVKAIEDKVTALVGEVTSMVTSVALWTADHTADDTHWNVGYGKECGDHFLSFAKIQEKDNTFPAKEGVTDKQFTFKKGNSVTYTDDIIVRVSPTNATLVPENISLINSKGEELTELVYVDKVEPYNELLTFSSRAATNNGLWKVTFKLRENYDADAFAAAVAIKENKVVKNVRFAMAVTNTTVEEGSAARRVISGYELGVEATDGDIAHPDFLVNGTSIWDIHNRYYACEDGSTTTKVKELVWLDPFKPAVAPITDNTNKNYNADDRYNNWDNRQSSPILPVVKGEPIKIQIDWNKNKGVAYNTIKGFYVTLDSEFALESVPSEINAWNSYEYENVGTSKQAAKMFDGNEGTITIKNTNNVEGDIIGFRVYAVNLDGTLLDPDGRAFYVIVGSEIAQATIEGTIEANALSVSTDYIDVTGKFVDCNTTPGWTADPNNPTYTGQAVADTKFEVKYYDKDKKELSYPSAAVKYVKFFVADVTKFIDNETYTQTIELKKFTEDYGYTSNNYTQWTSAYSSYTLPLAKITAKLTKVMPNKFPAEFAFRPKQEEVDGSGKFVAYMIPENDYAATTISTYGIKDLNNVFYGLDDNYKFVFETSAPDTDKDGVLNSVVVTSDGNSVYNLSVIAKDFIDNATWHNVSASYVYAGVSRRQNADGAWIVADWAVDYEDNLEVKYACWEDASEFAWGTYKQGTTTLSHKPALQWTAEAVGDKCDLSDIESTNSYNNTYFGLDLESLVVTKEWLVVDEVKLVVNGQENPYFVPSVEGNAIKFTQKGTQADAAPVADHEETLVIKLHDAFKCPVTIELPVTVKAPEKK